MNVDDSLILYLEDLSCFALSDSEKKCFVQDFQKILDALAPLSNLNTDGVPECSRPVNNVNIFRDDKANPSFGRASILENAPVKNDEYFIAPRTVE